MLDRRCFITAQKKIHIYAKAKFPVINIQIKAAEENSEKQEIVCLFWRQSKVKHNIER